MATSVAAAGAQNSGESLPTLVSHADAVYPAIARTAHITGNVVVKITTDGQAVIGAVAESGPALLRKASEDNAKTWKFARHTPGTFHVTYSYKIVGNNVFTSFPSSSVVEISAVASPAIIDYAWVGLGNWKAELRSRHGRLAEVFEFSYSGPHGEWLNVVVSDSPDSTDETSDDEVSRMDGDFLVFTMKIAEPDGKRLKTYFAGKISGDKIVGTFVDASGVRGTWVATRIVEPEKK
jgi:hypothetical protein